MKNKILLLPYSVNNRLHARLQTVVDICTLYTLYNVELSQW